MHPPPEKLFLSRSGGRGQETWNLCSCLWRPSFYDLFLQGRRAAWSPRYPGSATAFFIYLLTLYIVNKEGNCKDIGIQFCVFVKNPRTISPLQCIPTCTIWCQKFLYLPPDNKRAAFNIAIYMQTNISWQNQSSGTHSYNWIISSVRSSHRLRYTHELLTKQECKSVVPAQNLESGWIPKARVKTWYIT